MDINSYLTATTQSDSSVRRYTFFLSNFSQNIRIFSYTHDYTLKELLSNDKRNK